MGQRVAIVQRDIHWLDAERNLHDIEQMLAGVEADVVVLSEMFSTGFATDPREVADSGAVEQWMHLLDNCQLSCTIPACHLLDNCQLCCVIQCSCLENPRDGGAWWAAVYGVAQSWTRLKRLSSSRRYEHPSNYSVKSTMLEKWTRNYKNIKESATWKWKEDSEMTSE